MPAQSTIYRILKHGKEGILELINASIKKNRDGHAQMRLRRYGNRDFDFYSTESEPKATRRAAN